MLLLISMESIEIILPTCDYSYDGFLWPMMSDRKFMGSDTIHKLHLA